MGYIFQTKDKNIIILKGFSISRSGPYFHGSPWGQLTLFYVRSNTKLAHQRHFIVTKK